MPDVLTPLAAGGHVELTLLAVLVAAGGLLLLAAATGLPYPILLVVGGAVLGFAPGAPKVELDPDLVLILFLPPLLYAAASNASPRELRENLRPISLLTLGLVVVTTLGVGVVAHVVIGGLSWAACFTLGAVLSPTDPVAATAVASRAGAPRRFVTLIEGESLLNDASALIAYRFAVAATVTGTFSVLDAAGTFVLSAAGGVVCGLAVAWLAGQVLQRLEDPATEVTLSLLTPYFAYLPAEALGASAVLAAVSAGVWLGFHSSRLLGSETRLQARSFWTTLTFLLNAALFALLGLELPVVIDELGTGYGPWQLAGYAAAVSAAVIVLRFAWVYPTTWLPRRLFAGVREKDPLPPWGLTFLVAFTGMRGAVSLAAALAIPARTDAGSAFPARDLIIFLVFVVIAVTLVVQGLMLGPLVRRLDLADPHGERVEAGGQRARALVARAALTRLDEVEGEEWARHSSVERLRDVFDFRARRFEAQLDDDDPGEIEEGSRDYQRLRREILEAERAEIVRLRDAGELHDEQLRSIERDLDLEDERLQE